MRRTAFVLTACLSACGGVESALPQPMGGDGGDPAAVPFPGDPVPVEPPLPSAAPTRRRPPQVGRDESGARDEARTPRGGGSGSGTDTTDLLCRYICGGFPLCAQPEFDGKCTFCREDARIRPSCIERFEAIEVCLRAFQCSLLDEPGLAALVVACGVDASVLEACVIDEGPQPKPLPPPPPRFDGGV